VWLTFFGEFRGHGHPHESPREITVPLVILSAMAVIAGWLNAFGLHDFTKWTDNPVTSAAMSAARVTEAKFSLPDALISLALVVVSVGVVFVYYEYHAFGVFHERTRRSRPAHAGYAFLENKYYLDDLYTDGIVYSIKSPIARAAYWFDQHIIDAVVNAVATSSRWVASIVYRYIDQDLIDGAVNGAGFSAEEGASFLRQAQTGRVQQYAAIFFGVGVVAFGAGLLALTHAF
jgi:NADH-quinone oxidoreductase subunit L